MSNNTRATIDVDKMFRIEACVTELQSNKHLQQLNEIRLNTVVSLPVA